jgi:protein-S-isoprenylcysteine O-methyltransferase Ste14
MTTGTEPERTIGQLVADATHDVQGIVRSEIALAKAEVSSGAKVMGKGAGLLGGAAFVGLLGLIFLFHTIAQVIAVWLPVWAGYGITTLLLFIVAGVLGLLGKNALQKARPQPKRAIAEAQQTIATLKS